jgi:transcriptional regulator GlxA family with amidase domain
MYKIGAVIFPDFEMLDFFGPLQMFSMHRDGFRITTVAETAAPVPSSGGPSIVPDESFAAGNHYDILLVPGGKGTRSERLNQPFLDWLSQAADQAELVTSVCTGSLLLANAGILNGLKATTNKRAFDWVVENSPDGIQWQPKARWVEDGKVLTSSGVSAGMDMSLALIAKTLGETAARDAARWAEYNAYTDADFDPFSLEGQT